MTAALIAKLEGASEGSRELDARVECAVQGLHFVAMQHGWYVAGKGASAMQMSPPNPYTTSIDAALALANRVLPGGVKTYQIAGFFGRHGAAFGESELASAATPALAVCAAILRASAAEGADMTKHSDRVAIRDGDMEQTVVHIAAGECHSDYDTLCGLDGDDDAIGLEIVPVPRNGKARVNCEQCRAIWSAARAFPASGFAA